MILWTRVHQGPLFEGFSRQEYWSGLSCLPPGDLAHAGIKPITLMSHALTGGFFTTNTTWKAPWFVLLEFKSLSPLARDLQALTSPIYAICYFQQPPWSLKYRAHCWTPNLMVLNSVCRMKPRLSHVFSRCSVSGFNILLSPFASAVSHSFHTGLYLSLPMLSIFLTLGIGCSAPPWMGPELNTQVLSMSLPGSPWILSWSPSLLRIVSIFLLDAFIVWLFTSMYVFPH